MYYFNNFYITKLHSQDTIIKKSQRLRFDLLDKENKNIIIINCKYEISKFNLLLGNKILNTKDLTINLLIQVSTILCPKKKKFLLFSNICVTKLKIK